MITSQEHDSNTRSTRRLLALVALLLLFVLVASTFAAATPPQEQSPSNAGPEAALDLSLVPFASGLDQPIGIVSNGDRRLFILERKGVIRIARADGTVDPTPFLDITGRVDSSASETGLLGLSFHPRYFNNGYFYLNYTNLTDNVRRTRISRFQVTAHPGVADPASEEILLSVVQPRANHNAGNILFGPDGYLYIPLGDGGSGGALAQDPTTVLGKVLRIDVDSVASEPADCYGEGTGNYTVPADNPFVNGDGGTCDEIWASGLRNPWRSSFDSQTGDLFISDVGQNKWEEVNHQPAASGGGENYGWPCYEGEVSYNPAGCGPEEDYTKPIFVYSQDDGSCSVIGGYVYRGIRYPAMVGHYLLTDFCSGHFWDLVPDGGSGWTATMHNPLGSRSTAFGEACDGELYLSNINNGQIYHLQENSPVPAVPASIEVNGDGWFYFPFIAHGTCL